MISQSASLGCEIPPAARKLSVQVVPQTADLKEGEVLGAGGLQGTEEGPRGSRH